MYKLVKRQERLKDLLSSFPGKENKLRKRVYHIDSSFKHSEIQVFGQAERTIFHEAMSEFVEKQQKGIKQVERKEDKEEFEQMGQKLTNFSRKKNHSKTVHMINHTAQKRILHWDPQVKQKKIYIERKYNPQLSYQIHNIMQAKRIEDDRHRLKQQLSKIQQSPLINQVIKLTRSDRKTIGFESQTKMVNNFVKSLTQQLPDCFKNDRMSASHQKLLHNQKIRDVMDICQRQYIKPTTQNYSQSIKRYRPNPNAKLSTPTSNSNSPR